MAEKNQHTVKARDRHARGHGKVRCKNKENAGHRESSSSTRGVRPRDSPSPIHNTLGQVCVLFVITGLMGIFLPHGVSDHGRADPKNSTHRNGMF